MGANMARRLKDRGFHVTTLFDVNRAAVTALAQELGAAACPTLGDVTAGADVIFTVVSDDAAMRSHLRRRRQSARERGRKIVHQLRHRLARRPRGSGTARAQGRRGNARGVHGFEHHPGARRFALPHVRRKRGSLPTRGADAEGIELVAALCRQDRRSRESEGAGQHGDEHQHRGTRRRSRPRASARA